MISINSYINERLILNKQSTVHSDITDLYNVIVFNFINI